jgi:hypothetical protein
MLAFPYLAGAIGRLFVANMGTTPQLPVWGDGLVDRSLASLCYPTRWSSACEDELVFLIPSLASGLRPTTAAPPEATCYLRRALIAHVRLAAEHLPQLRGEQPQYSPPALKLIFESGTITTLSAREIAHEGEVAMRTFFGPNLPMTAASSRDGMHQANRQLARERWLFELSVLSCLDRMLATALRGCQHEHCLGLADAFVGSLHASFNCAYLYPELVYAHELLAVAAWLGNLVRGRAALMPAFVAERLTWELGFAGETVSQVGEVAKIGGLLRFYADLAVGSRRLLRQAHRARRSGRAQLVRPRLRGRSESYVWNMSAHNDIDHRLQRITHN